MASFQNDKLTICKLLDNKASWQNDILTRRQADKMVSRKRQVDNMTMQKQLDKMPCWQNGKSTKWLVDNMLAIGQNWQVDWTIW